VDFQELENKIDKIKLAITIDTSIIKQYQFNFNRGPLSLLEQFSEGPILVIFSDITIKESVKHLHDKIHKIKRETLKSLKDWNHNISKIHDLKVVEELDPTIKSSEIIHSFLERCSAIRIPIEQACLNSILESYFKSTPPFSQNKKNEFPDAIALYSLENWAASEDTHIISVSKDNDWIDYCKDSPSMSCIGSLVDALSLLQNKAEKYISDFMETVELSNYTSDLEEVLIDNFESIIQIYAEGDSRFHVDYPEVFIPETINIDLSNSELQVVGSKQNKVSLEGECDISTEVDISFALAIYDSIDKDYMSVGSSQVSTEIKETVSFILYFENNDKEIFQLKEIEFNPISITRHFGDLEPVGFGY
jgi:hypothetical protein